MRKIHLAGLAMVMAGVGAGTAHAGDVTITTDTTTPLATSNPDGSGVAGDITVAESGSITVGATQSAITVNSSNDAIVQGELASTNANDSVGIRIVGGNSGAITQSGAILLLEDYTLADGDNDGDLDGDFAQGLNRYGIFLQAGPTFTGDITGDGHITIEGNTSAAIRLDALLTGDIDYTGAITVHGENSVGVALNGGAGAGVTGDVSVHSAITIRGQNSIGVLVDAPIGGELSLSGAWSVTGFHAVTTPANPSTLEPEDMEQAGSALQINNNVAGGITLEGIGVENDADDDGDGESNEADDNAGLTINQFGSAPAVLIRADGADLLIGANAAGFGLQQRGGVSAGGVFEGLPVTAMRIEGDGLGATATLIGGIAIDNSLSAGAAEADAYSLYLGDGAIVPQVLVRGTVLTQVFSDPAQTSYGVFIASGANAPALTNSGAITANYLGETGTAAAITDQSGTLSTIINSGQIAGRVIPTDDDLTDDVPPPPVTGAAIAIDVSTSAANVSLQQVAPGVFTDDDAVDDFVATAPSITGEIRLGSGNDTVDLLAGTITGDIAFGLGADTFNIDNGAIFSGRMTDANGTLALNVTNGSLNVQGGTLNIGSATFGSGGALGVLLSDVPAESTFIEASGAVTFAPGAVVTPIVPAGLPQAGANVFLTANGGLVGAGNVTGPSVGPSTPFLYDISIETSGANSLAAVFDLKTPAELGLSANQSIAYDPILTALRLDAGASAAMAGVTTEYEFFDAYEDLLPNYSSASTEIAATAIQQMQSATSNRIAATRMQGLDETSVWGQEIAYGLNREPPNANVQEFRGYGFGFAGGIDGPTNNGALFGLSASFIASEVEEPGRPEGEVSAWFGQANAYYATAVGPIDLDFILGAGAGRMESRRFVEIGNPVAFRALAEADWMAYEGHGAIRASAPMSAGAFPLTPQAALTYVGISEAEYEEEGGGPAVDYQVDSTFSQRLWGDVGLELSARWRLGANAVLSPRLYGGYRANLIDEESERTVRFVSGGAPFTLSDEGLGEGGPLVGIGFDATNGYSTFSLGYEGEFTDQIERHSLNAAIRFRF